MTDVQSVMNSHAQTSSKSGSSGDISSVFPSLSGKKVGPLPIKFAEVQKLILEQNSPEAIQESWDRLLPALAKEIQQVRELGNKVIPEVNFKDLASTDLRKTVQKTGCVVIRGVIPQAEARQYKYDAEEYVKKNHAHGFPAENPTVFELYWSKQQMAARSHPNFIAMQRALAGSWHSTDPEPQYISLSHPVTYADRLRIRSPGDGKFALGPHIDGPGIERWEDPGHRHVYEKILEGKWEEYDAMDYRYRLDANSSIYSGPGQCSMFRMFQGWLSMSETGPTEGTLMVNPMLQLATAYVVLRPFFAPVTAIEQGETNYDPNNGDITVPWKFTGATSCFPNVLPGNNQELNKDTHPHLCLDETMLSIPKMNPGDYIAWHCDTIHAVEKVHAGSGDSSVLYIPITPLTECNLSYLIQQRSSFLARTPAPDFPGALDGEGESKYDGVGSESDISCAEGRQAMGLEPFQVRLGDTASDEMMVKKANLELHGRNN